MKDILLDENGDIAITKEGDLSIVESPIQAAMIKLKWFFGEWLYDPEKGIPWFEYVFLKNPNMAYIKSLLVEQMMEIEEVVSVPCLDIIFDTVKRSAVIRFEIQTSEETYRKEVLLHG